MKKERKIKILLFAVFINAFALIFNDCMPILIILSLLQLIASIYICCHDLSYKLISPINIFLCLSYLFHASKYFTLLSKTGDNLVPFALIYGVTASEMNKALCFYILIQSFLMLGVIISDFLSKKIKPKKEISHLFVTKDKKNYLILSIVLICIGIVPKLYINISSLILYLEEGYLAIYKLMIPGFISFLSRLFEFGMIMLLLYFSNDKKKSTIVLSVAILSEALSFMSGSRGGATVLIVVYLMVFFTKTIKINLKKLKWKHWLTLLLLFHIGCSLLSFINDYRVINREGINPFTAFIPYLFKFSLLDIIDEFGGTMISVILAMRFIPSYSPFGHGISYGSAFLNVLPNINGFIDAFRDNMVYVTQFPSEFQYYLGGSYIGELYYNFGYFSFIFAILVGIFIGFICHVIEKQKHDNSLLVIICLVMYVNILWWIRNYFAGMTREIIWFAVFILLLNQLLNLFEGKIDLINRNKEKNCNG